MDLDIYCVSNNRPQNVKKNLAMFGNSLIFVVGDEQNRHNYMRQGAENIIVTNGKLIAGRNYCVKRGYEMNRYSLQVSDDIRRFNFHKIKKKVGNKFYYKKYTADTMEVINIAYRTLRDSPYKLLGLPPTENIMAVQNKPSFKSFIIGDFTMTKPNSLTYDPKLVLKEDYDYTMQHITKYGGVVRLNDITMNVIHYGNDGGCVDYRSERKEKDCKKYLMQKWPGKFIDHPTRRNEVILRA